MSRSDILRLIELNGFSLHRQNKHLVFKDAGGNNFVISKTPSDHRAELNQISHLKSVVNKLGRKFIETKPKKERENMQPQFNPPKIVTAPVTLQTKPLDKDATEFILKCKQEGWKTKRIADALTSMGYRLLRGGPIRDATVSVILIENGFRTLNRASKNPTKEKKQKVELKAEQPKSTFLLDLTEILTSNINEAMKEKLVMSFIDIHRGGK
jgi:hypothetical protein